MTNFDTQGDELRGSIRPLKRHFVRMERFFMHRLLVAACSFLFFFSPSLQAQDNPDNHTNDGPYQFFRKGNLVVSGYYKNGQKDSLWEVYSPKGVVLSRKWFAGGKRSGVWEFFNLQGEAEWSYDFGSGQAAYQKPVKGDTAVAFYQTDAGDWVNTPVDHPLYALMGSAERLSFLVRTLRYPDEAQIHEQQGKVIVAVGVDEDGNITDYTVVQSAAPSLDKEALRVVKLYPYEFLPAEKNGKKIKAQYRVPVVFKIDVAR